MAEHYMAQKMPLALCAAFIQTEGIEELEVPIIRLIHYLYVESEHFYPIEKHDSIVPFDSIKDKKITLNHSKSKINPQEFMGESLNFLMKKL